MVRNPVAQGIEQDRAARRTQNRQVLWLRGVVLGEGLTELRMAGWKWDAPSGLCHKCAKEGL
jgi:hypothetical protein